MSDECSVIQNQCLERFVKLESVARTFEEHDKESVGVRDAVTTHTEILKGLCAWRAWWLGTAVTIVGALVSIAVMWGMLLNRVSSLEKYTEFIMKHSYGVQDFEAGRLQ